MLKCYQTQYDGPKVTHNVKVYCLPQASARLLRGKSFECVDGRETKFGGWDLCDKQAEEFGIITPLGHNFITNESLGKSFTIIGNPPNTDITALFDAAKTAATNQDVMSIQLITPVRVCVETWGPPGGYGYTMGFEKQSGIWKEVDRVKRRQ